MSENYLKLAVIHLCPSLLNTDSGNVLVFKNRAKWRGVDVEILRRENGLRLNPKRADFIFIGSGQNSYLKAASEELYSYKDSLLKAQEANIPMLAVGLGYCLSGNYYQPLEGEILAGTELLDITTNEVADRFTGNALGQADFLNPKTIVGFENKNYKTHLRENTEVFMEIRRGAGNNGEDKTEGAKCKNVFGTNFGGPVLAQNPHLCDYLITLALKRKYGEKFTLENLDDDIEKHAHKERVLAKY